MTTATPTTMQYTKVAKVLHWLIALAVTGLLISGFSAEDLPRGHPDKALWMFWHKSTGITVLFLMLGRLLWRLRHKPPALPASMNRFLRTLASFNHWLFYVLLFSMPLTGWAVSSIFAVPISWYGLFEVPLWPFFDDIADKKSLGSQIFTLHVVGAYVVVAALGLHALGAVWHIIKKDGMIWRMLPGKKNRD